LTEPIGGSEVDANPVLSRDLIQIPSMAGASDIGPAETIGNVDILLFKAQSGQVCLGARRLGPRASFGLKWILIASECYVTYVQAVENKVRFAATLRVRGS